MRPRGVTEITPPLSEVFEYHHTGGTVRGGLDIGDSLIGAGVTLGACALEEGLGSAPIFLKGEKGSACEIGFGAVAGLREEASGT